MEVQQEGDIGDLDQLMADATLSGQKQGQIQDQAKTRRAAIKKMAANYNPMQNVISAMETQATGGSHETKPDDDNLTSILTSINAAAGGDVYFQACVRAVERMASLGTAGLDKCAGVISMIDDTDTDTTGRRGAEYNPRAVLLMNPLATQHDAELANRVFETYGRISKMVHDRHNEVGDVPLGVLYSFPAVLDHRTIPFTLREDGEEMVTQVMLLHHRVESDPGPVPITALSKHTKARVAEFMAKEADNAAFKGESDELREHRRTHMRYMEYTDAVAELSKQCAQFLKCIHSMGILYGPMPPRFIYCTTKPKYSMYLTGTLYCSLFNPDENALRPHIASLRRFDTLGEHQLYVSPRIFDDAAVYPAYFTKDFPIASRTRGMIETEVAKVRQTLFSADYYSMGIAMLVANLEAGTRKDGQNEFTEATLLEWNDEAINAQSLHRFYETVLKHADGALRDFTPGQLEAYREKNGGKLPKFIDARMRMRTFIRDLIMGEFFGGLTVKAVEAVRHAAPLRSSLSPDESKSLLADSMKRANSHRQSRLEQFPHGGDDNE